MSKIRKAFGQFSATRQPNCSSVINRSNNTIVGCKTLINSSKEETFNSIATSSMFKETKSTEYNFYTSTYSKDGYQSICKQCVRESHKQYREELKMVG